jgi:hypothetical protein
MDETYWDTMSADYDGQIFSCLDQDRDSVIVSAINRFADEALTACDFGCGVGKFLSISPTSSCSRHAWIAGLSRM